MGLLDFGKGIAEGVSDIAENIGGAVVNTGKAGYQLGRAGAYVADPHHWDNIAHGVGAAGSFVAEHPGQTWDIGFEVGRHMLKEQLKPQNLIMNAALLATGVGAPALIAKMGLAGEGVAGAIEAGEAVSAGSKAVESISAGTKAAEGVQELSRGQRFLQGAAQGLEKVDKVLQAPQQLQNKALEMIPGGRKVLEFSEWRGAQAEKVMNWGGESKIARTALKPIATRVSGGDMWTSAEQGGGSYNKAKWRQGRLQTAMDPASLAGRPAARVQKWGNITKTLANPQQAAMDLAKGELKAHGGQIAEFAVEHGGEAIMKKMLGGGDDKKNHSQHDYAPTPTGQGVMGSTWARPESYGATRNTMQSSRDTGDITTVMGADTMPRSVGPSNWYGPQNGYSAGRGFSGGNNVEGI